MAARVMAIAYGTAFSPYGLSRQAASHRFAHRPTIARGPLDADWPCPQCGVIGCIHDDDLPEYDGAFYTEGRI